MKLHRNIIRRTEVLKRTGKATSTIYEQIRKGLFPKPVKLGPRSVGWVEDEVDDHVAALIEERDQSSAPLDQTHLTQKENNKE